MRRNQINTAIQNQILKYKDIKFNISTKQVFVDNKEIVLTATEMKILQLLLSQPQKFFPKLIYLKVFGMRSIR